MGFAAVISMVAGETAFSAVALASAIGTIGLEVTAVGLITDNKDLLKIGSVLGLAGGIGGLAAGAMEGTAAVAALDEGSRTAAAAAFDSAPDAMVGFADGAVLNGSNQAATQGLADGAMADGAQRAATQGLADGAAATASDMASNAMSPASAQAVNPSLESMTSAPTTTTPTSAGPGSIGTPIAQGANTPMTPDSSGYVSPNDALMAQGSGGFAPGASQPASSFFGKLFPSSGQLDKAGNPMGWLEANKTAVQLGSGVLSGIQRSSQFDQQRALQQQQLAQQISHPVAYRPGIINGAR